MRRAALLISVLLLLSLNAGPAAESSNDRGRWYVLEQGSMPAPARLDAVQATEKGLELRLTVAGFLSRSLVGRGGPRGALEIPGSAVTGKPGEPSLPVLRYLIEVPPAAEIELRLTPGPQRSVRLEELQLAGALQPVQLPVPKLAGAKARIPFVEDVEIYAKDAYWPAESVELIQRAVLRGRHVALIEIRPIRYNPIHETLTVWSEAVLQIEFEGGMPIASAREKGRLASRQLDAWIERQIVAPTTPAGEGTAQEATAGGAAEGAAGMLVVAHDDFVDAVTPLLDWKRRSGFKVELVRTSDLGTAPTDSDVKAAIQQRYDSWSEPPLEFLLVVGDTDFTPIHDGNGGGNSQVTDNWYACLDGPDYLPDVAVARISTRTPSETATVVDKLLTYEQATFTSDTWIKTAGFIGTSDSGYIGLIEGTHDWCIDSFFTPNGYLPTAWSHGYASCDRHYHTYDADTSEIAAAIDEGRSIVNYSGHGGTTSWQGPTSHGGYGQSDVLANTNAGMYPFVISNACVTGTLDATECFGETWQKSPGGGAIGFWGASNNSYWDEDDVLQRALHANIFPMDETPPLGVIVNETKLDLYTHYGDTGSVAYYFDMYNLLSEPSLSLWTRSPRELTVVYPGAIPIGESSFALTVTHQGQPVEDALVAVRNVAEGVFEAGYTDATGQLTLILDPAPQSVATLEVTATGHDYRPWQGTAEVISPDSPWLLHREHTLDDSTGGDGDGRANPGEEIVVSVDVENVGEQPGSDLQGTLRTSTPLWCEVLDGQASFPDLTPHESGSSLPDHFRIRVTDQAPDGALLGLDLDWSAAGGSAGTTSFSESVEAVDLALDGYAIDDLAEGNGNGVAGPGETVKMTLDLVNLGHRSASGIHGTLSVDPTYITLLQDAADFPDLASSGQGTSLPPAYRFAVAQDAPDQQSIPFTLTLTEAGSGYGEVVVFDVMISSCSTTPATDVPHAIEDDSTAQSHFDYPYGIAIDEVNVYVEIDHTYRGDLRVVLASPAGTEVVLHDRTGGGTDDIVTWYDTETEPAQSMSAFVGENAFGQWTLTVEDHAGGDTGSLDGWALELCGELISPTPVLEMVSHSLSDEGACDPDGIGDVGEQVRLEILVRNSGWAAATGVRASVDCDAAVAILDGPAVLPDLAPGAESMATFDLLIGAVECLAPVTLNLSMQCNEGVMNEALVVTLESDVHDLSEAEDMEHAGADPTGWSHSALLGTDDWRGMSDRNHTPAGIWSWHSAGSKLPKDVVLVSPSFPLFGGSTVEFWHWAELEDGHDGGVFEISDDDGATWTDLGAWMTSGGYDGTLTASNPLGGREAWFGIDTEWRNTTVDLAAWSGSSVRLRWRLAFDDNLLTANGWWIDDIVVQTQEEACDAHACGVPGEVQLTDVRKTVDGVQVEWWNDPVCFDFRVWRSTDPTAAAQFVDVTSEDPDPTDNGFLDTHAGSLFWIIEGSGPDGDGPWGHYGQ
jgi:subtilisin-like proprotein convertase family protein